MISASISAIQVCTEIGMTLGLTSEYCLESCLCIGLVNFGAAFGAPVDPLAVVAAEEEDEVNENDPALNIEGGFNEEDDRDAAGESCRDGGTIGGLPEVGELGREPVLVMLELNDFIVGESGG